jgi:hypothetical protein
MRRRLLLNKPTPYLRVQPETVQWVNVTVYASYNIESNTDWLVD